MRTGAATSMISASVISDNVMALTWLAGLVAIVAALIGIVAHVPFLASTRLSRREQHARVRLAQADRLGVVVDGAPHEWNMLVERHAISYAQAHRFASRAKRWLTLASSVAILIALVGPTLLWINLTAGVLDGNVSRTTATATAMMVVGGAFAILFAGLLALLTAMMLIKKVQRDRMPLAWRILHRGSGVLRWLSGSDKTYLDLGHERPQADKTLSAPMVRLLLEPLEAELIVTMTASPRAAAGRRVEWTEQNAPLLAELLREKAQLLDAAHSTVPVRDVYAWLDLVASRCVLDPPGAASRSHLRAADALLNDRAVRNARNTLGLGAWGASGVILVAVFLALTLACVGTGALIPALSTISVSWFGSVAAGAIVSLGGWILKSATNRRRSA